jgi:hypothetical protein
MLYLSELQTYWDEGTVNISDPRVYAANIQGMQKTQVFMKPCMEIKNSMWRQ